jgi:hypothetical protein
MAVCGFIPHPMSVHEVPSEIVITRLMLIYW